MTQADQLSAEQQAEWQSLEERATHSDTMRPLSLLEAQWLDDYRELHV